MGKESLQLIQAHPAADAQEFGGEMNIDQQTLFGNLKRWTKKDPKSRELADFARIWLLIFIKVALHVFGKP